MILALLIIIPAALGLLTLFIRGEEKRIIRRRILMTGAALHALLTAALYFPFTSHSLNAFIALDSLGLLFLSIASFLFLLVSIYSFGYFFKETHTAVAVTKGVRHLYTPCMLFFLSAMTLATMTPHLGLLWISVEATTLACAPLIYYHHHEQALEAAWKYLLICSVGIALALLGIFFFMHNARHPDPRWLRIGLILIMVGFGTKMGLAPMHTWLPDAHSEAPSPVSALLSGVLLNTAFLGILRAHQICSAAGLAEFSQTLLIFFGIFSLFTAAVFITGQRDYKRLLAYSSVEHMGILALGVGVGAGFGTLLHTINHSLAKALLFLTAGHIVLAVRSKKIAEVQGLFKTLPATGFLLLVGGLAIIGSPPFGPFLSEFLILRDGLAHGHFIVMPFYLLFLGIIFVSMSRAILGMVQGEKKELAQPMERYFWMTLPPAVFAAIVLLLGIYLPAKLVDFLKTAARLLEASA